MFAKTIFIHFWKSNVFILIAKLCIGCSVFPKFSVILVYNFDFLCQRKPNAFVIMPMMGHIFSISFVHLCLDAGSFFLFFNKYIQNSVYAFYGYYFALLGKAWLGWVKFALNFGLLEIVNSCTYSFRPVVFRHMFP